MQRAFNDIAIEKSLVELRKGVRAYIVGSIEVSIHVVERNFKFAYRDTQHLAGFETLTLCNCHPVFIVLLHVDAFLRPWGNVPVPPPRYRGT
jgi:hypothetical protein